MKDQVSLPSFELPPVHEVAISVQFKSLENFQTVHIGEFWSRIADALPNVDDAQPFADNEEQQELRVEVMDKPPLRRVRMANADKSISIQLQATRFVANWVKVTKETEYPRFKSIYAEFEKYYQLFQDFLREKGLTVPSPSHLEVTYVNEFADLGEEPMKVLEPVLNFCKWTHVDHPFLSQPEVVNFVWQFSMPNAPGKLVLTLSPAKKIDGTKVVLFVLRCVSGPIAESTTPPEWFAAAHECIVRSFTELTTETAHKQWIRS